MSPLRNVLHLFLTFVVVCRGQPILPSLSYPVFVLTPPDSLQAPQQVVPVAAPYQTAPHLPEQGYEVSQFHTQDELGRVVFGFHGPDQSRMESRSMDGSIKGTYSYVDPNGNIVKMNYWDDGSGFHVSGNALPNGHPQYTPEVAAARAAHLKIYQAILHAAQQLTPQVVSDGSYVFDNGDLETSVGHSHFSSNLPQFNKEKDPNSLYGDGDADSVLLDNPELFNNYNYQEEDRNEEEKQGVSEVEGEVDLGEDVGPDEDEEEEPEINEDQESDREHYFRNRYNQKPMGRVKILENQQQREKINLKSSEDESKTEELTDIKNGDKDNDSGNQNDGHEENESQNEEDEHMDEAQKNHESDRDSDENEEGNDEHKGESEADKHFETLEHLFEVPDSDRRRFKDISDQHDHSKEQDESYDEMESVHSDASTAENRNSQAMSHFVIIPQNAESLSPSISFGNDKMRLNSNLIKERIEDQIFYKNNPNPQTSPKRAFFYHYQHTIPKPIERVDLEEENVAVSVLSNTPNSQKRPEVVQPSLLVQSLPDSVQQSSVIVKQSVIQGPSFVNPPEIHDVQVSPRQTGFNSHIFPIYLSEHVR